ncbi:MAG: folate-binding protein YgfZ [Hyphomicrobiaceae bacterium]|nr:folate-binding protein YgfZ [Hyphomicrobiaceae bacterium]
MAGQIARLEDRGVVAVTGADARTFLDGLATAKVASAPEGSCGYGALLTPQGKILFDFLGHATADGIVLDCPAAAAADLARRLGFYKLRAKVAVADVSGEYAVLAGWNGAAPIAGAGFDPRHGGLGWRAVVPAASAEAAMAASGAAIVGDADWQAHRIGLAIPEAGRDFAYGDAFPHDADLDQFGGVDFKKGCYVGQEVVSRMQHRGLARRRIVVVEAEAELPAAGTEIVVGAKAVGTLGSSAGRRGLALVRLDRVKEALDAGAEIAADGRALRFSLPEWARFGWPETTAAD